jgi:hypothetical protein
MIDLSKSPVKDTFDSLAACMSLGYKSGSYIHGSNGEFVAQYANLLTPDPLASKSAGFSSSP